jgi:L-2-hydroxyglutarate oxidase LhgO
MGDQPGDQLTADNYQRSTSGSQLSSLSSALVINAAGLECDTVAHLEGIDVDRAGYRLHWAKGSYFAVRGTKRHLVSRLIYPMPPKESLGVHAVIDLGGGLRFGPDVEYLDRRTPDYQVDESKRHTFGEAIRRIVPAIADEDLSPDMSGIRPKLQAKGESQEDFIIRNEKEKGLDGLINLIGIDSPGLTASPGIATYVRGLLSG